MTIPKEGAGLKAHVTQGAKATGLRRRGLERHERDSRNGHENLSGAGGHLRPMRANPGRS